MEDYDLDSHYMMNFPKVLIFMPFIWIVARRRGDQLARPLSYLQRPVNRQPGFRPRTRRAEAKIS